MLKKGIIVLVLLLAAFGSDSFAANESAGAGIPNATEAAIVTAFLTLGQS